VAQYGMHRVATPAGERMSVAVMLERFVNGHIDGCPTTSYSDEHVAHFLLADDIGRASSIG
jgi:hypothetical protein